MFKQQKGTLAPTGDDSSRLCAVVAERGLIDRGVDVEDLVERGLI
jgi:hypothetical protein